MYNFALRQAIIDAICSCFWYHDTLKKFMLGCGVPERYYNSVAQKGVKKGIYTRQVVEELAARGKAEREVLDCIAIELSKFTGVVDKSEMLDPIEAVEALSHLRLLAGQSGLLDRPATHAKDSEKLELDYRAIEDVRKRFHGLSTVGRARVSSEAYSFNIY